MYVVDEKGKLLKYWEVSQEEREAPAEESLRSAEQARAALIISYQAVG